MSLEGDRQTAWCWQNDEFRLDCDSSSPLVLSRALWDDDPSNLFEASTPVHNVYTDSECPASSRDSGGSRQQGSKESPHYKRRRMLQFSASDSIASVYKSPTFTTIEEFQNTLMDDTFDLDSSDPLSSPSLWLSRIEEANSSGSNSFDQPMEDWMSQCFSEQVQVPANSDDQTVLGGFDDHIDVSGNEIGKVVCEEDFFCWVYYNLKVRDTEICAALQTSDMASWQEQQPPPSCPPPGTGKSVVGGPVAYPFALIKPCGDEGDVTLKEINQRISISNQAPTPDSEENAPNNQCATLPLPTSPFSGKAVVHLTKIHTEGKGSITIMRTKG